MRDQKKSEIECGFLIHFLNYEHFTENRVDGVSLNLILKTCKRFISAWTKETKMVSIFCSSFIYLTVLQGGKYETVFAAYIASF